ncbi:MAG: response regulator [Calditerrivibrio sp.]|nr:response regulator [Calditerrivibrio sp.]
MAKIDKQSLIEFFKIESEEHLEIILNGLQTLSIDTENWSIIDEIFRSAHTLKGSAAMVGFKNISAIAHHLENLFDFMRIGSKRLNKTLISRVIILVEDFNSAVKNTNDDLTEDDVTSFSERINAILSDAESHEPKESSEDKTTPILVTPTDRKEILQKADDVFDKISKIEKSEQFIHLKINQIDNMVNILGEIVTNKNRENAKIKEIIEKFEELNYSTQRLNSIVSNIEQNFSYTNIYEQQISKDTTPQDSTLTDDFSLGELDRYDMFNVYSRQLSEIVNDINLSYKAIQNIFETFKDDILSINRLIDKLRKDITSARMIPVDKLFNTAIMAAKTAAMSENKEISIMFSGEKLSIDQSVFDALKESFIHLVRNAISHGIEKPEKRILSGKPEKGVLILKAQRYENSLVFDIEDDGSGIDIDKVRKIAIEKGLVSQYEAENMRADKVIEFLFLPGFTTKETVSDLSGRGVGLDVVKDSIEKLGGYVKLSSESGKGTKITITLPLREVIGEYLYIKENGQLFAIPLLYINAITAINLNNLKEKMNVYQYNIRGENIDIYDLGYLIKQTNTPSFVESASGIILHYRGKKFLITVDEILYKVMTVTKPLPHSIRHIKYFSAATITASGEIALILDPSHLITGLSQHKISVVKEKTKTDKKEKAYTPNSVLVVDDSLSIRKYLSKILSSIKCYYEEATDGISAINKLRERKFDLIITDLEMPLMNGYELINNIRNEMLDRSTPIFVVTSRATDKHKNKALELGANDFIMKPFDEDEIVAKIKETIVGKALL